jgi:hypothetical protein
MKLFTMLFVTVTGFSGARDSTAPLCEKEIIEHNNHRKIRMVSGLYISRQYKQDAKSAFKRRHLYVETIKSEFCEALVNAVVRIKTAHLRRNMTVSDSSLKWSKFEKKYTITYQGNIKNGFLVHEICSLDLPDVIELTTVNGQICDNPRLSLLQLKKVLNTLAQDGMKISDLRITVPVGQREAAEELVKTLNLGKRSLICETAKGGPIVLIRITQS